MSTFLKLIPLEMSAIDKFIEPEIELDEQQDHVVGIMTEDLKRLFTVWRNAQKSLAERIWTFKFGDTKEIREQAKQEEPERRMKANVLQEIFFIAVSDDFGLWDKGRVGVRQGFRVIWREEEENSFGGLLRRITGGDLDI